MEKYMNLNIKGENVDLSFPNPYIKSVPTVYIGKIELGQEEIVTLKTKTKRELFLFGATIQVKINMSSGEMIEGKRLEFIVLERNLDTNQITEHHLAQHDSVMYKRKEDKTGEAAVDMLMITKQQIPYLHRKPRWKSSEADIPEIGNQLFYFASQFYFPINKVNKEYFICGETAYVFLHVTEKDELLVQIFTQDMSEQTAEDHYRLEEMMAEYEHNYNNLNIVRNLIQRGDKYFYEYILESKRTNRQVLEILLEFAKTKKMKTEIEKRLK